MDSANTTSQGSRYITIIMAIAKRAEKAGDNTWAIAIHGLPTAVANVAVTKIEGSVIFGNAVVKGFKEPKEGPLTILTFCLNVLADMNYEVIASNGADPGPLVWTLQAKLAPVFPFVPAAALPQPTGYNSQN